MDLFVLSSKNKEELIKKMKILCAKYVNKKIKSEIYYQIK